MPLFDLSQSELEAYKPEQTAADDFDDFWAATLESARKHDLAATFEPADYRLELVDVFDTSFGGWNGERVSAWLLLPRERSEPLPTVVEYIGYGGGRGLPYQHLLMPAAGYATLVMDTRGQGSGWSPGTTPDPEPEPGTGQHPGFLTRGVSDPHSYYYRRLITDAVRAVECAAAHPAVDASRIAVQGTSQGGGLALAVGALEPRVGAVVAHVPFLCHFRRAAEITDEMPYKEIGKYLKIRRDEVERTFRTLSYVDGMNFASRATAPALFSAALMDMICPPSTVYAAYNHYTGPKEITVWPYNGHEGGEMYQEHEDLAFLREHLRADA